jgi:hypothetical protein
MRVHLADLEWENESGEVVSATATVEVEYDVTHGYRATWDEPGAPQEVSIRRLTIVASDVPRDEWRALRSYIMRSLEEHIIDQLLEGIADDGI